MVSPVFSPLEGDDPAAVAGYRLTARLGSGGMGKVYLSYTPGGRPVAIKVIRPEFSEDPEFRRRFAGEVRAAQRVQGLYTAPVIDCDTDARTPWLATAYVPGPSLAEAVAGHGALPASTVALLVAGVAEALQVIHGTGIVHRDLKPSNVLLAGDGPRVIDFGIARAADATSLTGSGATIGTPAFMAPEQAVAGEISPATDVFALGQVAAYAARGIPAFGEGPSHGVLYRVVHEEPDLDGLPQELHALVSRCLAKDAAHRPGVPEVIRMCQQASGKTQLVRPEDWLPGALAADITQRTAAPAPHTVTEPGPVAQARPHAPPMPPTAPGAAYQQTAPATAGPYAPASPPPMRTAGAGTAALQRPDKRRAGKIVAAVAVTVVVVAGGAAALWAAGGDKDGGKGGAKNGPQASRSPDAAQRPDQSDKAGAGPSASGKPSQRPDPRPRTYPDIQLTSEYYLDFADEPPKPRDPSSYSHIGDFEFNAENDRFTAGSAKFVLLNNAQQGSLKTCRAETRYTEELQMDRVSKGSQVCVYTDSGHIGLVTYKQRSPESDPSDDYITIDLTVWRNATEPTEDE
ncbi:serine/threonine-protein kinase [Streptomyces albiaxialis]|uniref:Serine/threonine-protein kinase n=1 Tax=Streptomyces albiaxialis TaxID=329523 RepID=A0ABN2W6B4_9ACTN